MTSAASNLGEVSRNTSTNVVLPQTISNKTRAIQDLKSAQLELNERLWRNRFGSLAKTIAANPVASQMQTVVTQLARPDSQLILDLFVYLHGEAADMERLLTSASEDRKGLLLQQFESVVSSLFDKRQIVDNGLFLYYAKNPAELALYLRLGFASSSDTWTRLASDKNKAKFVKDVLDSPKGYPKTARSVEDWAPPQAVSLTSTLSKWLDGFSNTSVFSGMAVRDTSTVRQQIDARFAKATPQEKDYLWFSAFFQLATALDINEGGELKRAALAHQTEITEALRSTPLAGEAIAKIGAADTIWSSIMG